MLTKEFDLNQHFPLIAIIRGVLPDDVIRIADILVQEGFTMLEVPLNSPDALDSISRLVKHFGDKYLIGAGTVTTPEQAKAVIETGANLVVTPNMNAQVIKMAVEAGCATFPGVVTPTEAFDALAAGATGLKLFPVTALGLDGFKALKSVAPKETLFFPVGGINPTEESMKPYVDAGAHGFGLGSALYKPSMTDDEVRNAAQQFVKSFNNCA